MLFVTSAPIQVEILEDRKVIILTNNKIMFSHLDFIEEYLSMPLITVRPRKMCYESDVMQVMVVSDTTLQVYYCDWKTQIKLLKVVILNNETVDSIWYQKQSGWHIFGSMAQYQPARISFHKSEEAQANYLCKCFINKNKYIITKTQLLKSESGSAFKQVTWKDKMMVLKNCNFEIKMTGAQTLDKKRDIICINQTYILIISRFEVISMIVQPVVAFYENNLLISHVQKGKLTTIQKYQNNYYSQLGTINRQNGQICGAFLYQDDILLLQYQKKQIHLNFLPLVSEVDNTQNSKKSQKKKKLFQSISRIMQQSHEQGSQFIPKDDKNNPIRYHSIEGSQKTETHYYPNQKPIIRHITVQDDDQIKSNTLNQSASEVLSRSGIDAAEKRTEQNNKQQLQKNYEQLSFEADNHFRSLKNQFKSMSVTNPKKNPRQIYSYNSNQNTVKNENCLYQNDLSQQKSQKSKSSRRQNFKIKNPTGKNQSFQNVSNENVSFEDHVETPAFGFQGGFGSDKWGEFDKQWDQVKHDEISQLEQEQMQQSLCIENQKSILKFMPEKPSKKVEVFKPKSCILTTEFYNKIQKTPYCTLITKATEQDPDRIQQLLDLFLPNVLEQAEAPLFFEKNIRTFNPQFTQDKIRTLFGSIINNKSMQQKMTNALQLFKLSQVPKQILCFPQDFIKVLSIICKQIYIQDLIKPTQATIQYILNYYFSIQKFPEQIITIQDEEIDITHPRNMLNILLYLNQSLQLKIDSIIKIYCAKLIDQNLFEILKKITLKENIFQICQVPRTVLDQVIIERFNQLLNQSVQNSDYLWGVIQFLSKPLLDQYRIRLAIVNQFNKCNIVFDMSIFIDIKQPHTDIYLFLEKVINQNSCRNLSNLKIGSIYRSLYWLQQGQKITNVTNQYIELVKSLAQKFCEKKYFYYAFLLLDTILPKIKISFIAKLLYNNLSCKFINRIIGYNNTRGLQNIFSEITSSPDLDPILLPNDKIKIPQFSNSLSCSWTKFNSIIEKYLDVPLQLKVLIFCQINTANQLFLTLEQNTKQKFLRFMSEIQQNIIIQLDSINQNDNSVNPKGVTSIKFQDYPKYDNQSEAASSTLNRQDVLMLQQDKQVDKKIVYKSMTLIDHYNQLNPQKLFRRNSADQKADSKSDNEDLVRIKLLVNKKQIIDELKQIYTTKSQQIFMKSLKLVDQQKIQLHHIDIFKAIMYKQVDYPLSSILPFQIFLTTDINQAFELSKQKITAEVTIKNFWTIFVAIELIFKMGIEVVNIFINKCIVYFRNDSYAEIIKTTLNVIKPKLNKNFIKNMISSANSYGLTKIKQCLNQYERFNNLLK